MTRAGDGDVVNLELERATLSLINMVAYSSSSREHARRFRDATRLELPTSDIRMLEYLVGREPVATSSLASALQIDIAQASRRTGQLAAAGHVDRASDPADRRRTLLTLTEPTTRLLDQWLISWAVGYDSPTEGWPGADVDDLAAWFDHVHASLRTALPHRPTTTAGQRWLDLTAGSGLTRAHAGLVSTMVGLVAWVGQSGGFNDLLESHGAPIRQHGYLTLRVVSHHGPLSVAEVADRMTVDASQASRRLRQLAELGLVDRAVDAFDRRSNVVRISRKGAALERRIRTAQLHDFAGILGEMAPGVRARRTELAVRYVGDLLSGTDEPRPAAALG